MKLRSDLETARKEEAIERQAAYDAKSIEEKLQRLDGKFGKGLGAKKVREKLAREQKEGKKKPLEAMTLPENLMEEPVRGRVRER